jgi:DNA-directed RNA polymerase subunit RPC12/RpoP
MLHFIGKATFKCKQCGHTFEAFYTEGGIRCGPNLPHCPKCGSGDTRKENFIDKLLKQ